MSSWANCLRKIHLHKGLQKGLFWQWHTFRIINRHFWNFLLLRVRGHGKKINNSWLLPKSYVILLQCCWHYSSCYVVKNRFFDFSFIYQKKKVGLNRFAKEIYQFTGFFCLDVLFSAKKGWTARLCLDVLRECLIFISFVFDF